MAGDHEVVLSEREEPIHMRTKLEPIPALLTSLAQPEPLADNVGVARSGDAHRHHGGGGCSC